MLTSTSSPSMTWLHRDHGAPAHARQCRRALPGHRQGDEVIDHRRRSALGAFRTPPSGSPGEELGVDVVIESTGFFTERLPPRPIWVPAPRRSSSRSVRRRRRNVRRSQRRHVQPGPPAHHLERLVHDELPGTDGEAVLEEAFKLEQGLMTTIHAYTGDQQLLTPASRCSRPAAVNAVPTSTGKGSAIGLVVKKLDGRMVGDPCRSRLFADRSDSRTKKKTTSTPSTLFKAAARSGPLRVSRVQRGAHRVIGHRREPLPRACSTLQPSRCLVGTTTRPVTATVSSIWL